MGEGSREDIAVDWPDAAAGGEAQDDEVTSPDQGAGDGDEAETGGQGDEGEVEETSEESFPASDPPAW